jgi:hypothetical protein
MGWAETDPACARFDPSGDVGHALRLAERLAGVDLVLHHYAARDGAGPFWMAWFGQGQHAVAATPALAVTQAALLYVLSNGAPGSAVLKAKADTPVDVQAGGR